MPFYRDPGGGLHFLSDTSFENLLPAGCVLITAEDAATAPAPSAEDLRSYAAAKRYAVETGGCPWTTHVINTDRESQSKMIAEFVAISGGMRADPSPWKFKGGEFASLSNTEMGAVAMAARAHIAAAFATEANVLASITAGTITTYAQIDAAAWPSNT